MARIAVLPGDGIGPEVCREAIKVLEVVSSRFDIPLTFEEAVIGGAAIDRRLREVRRYPAGCGRGAEMG
jgi:3-isopropylmalate dehydrogenase